MDRRLAEQYKSLVNEYNKLKEENLALEDEITSLRFDNFTTIVLAVSVVLTALSYIILF